MYSTYNAHESVCLLFHLDLCRLNKERISEQWSVKYYLFDAYYIIIMGIIVSSVCVVCTCAVYYMYMFGLLTVMYCTEC